MPDHAAAIRFKDFTKAVTSALVAHPEWRHGQAAFNILYDLDPKLANRIRGGKQDPFYDNGRLADFLDVVKGTWGAEDV